VAMANIAERYNGKISFTNNGEVNLTTGRYPTILQAIAVLSLGNPQTKDSSEKLKNKFNSVFPNFNLTGPLQKSTINKETIKAEQYLQNLDFLGPTDIIIHPLKKKLIPIYKEEKDQSLVKIKLISGWLQFIQGKVEEKKDLSPLSYLILGNLIQSNYLIQARKLMTHISSTIGKSYFELQGAHKQLILISSLLLNPKILYSQPYKQMAEERQEIIARIKKPETAYYNDQYESEIKNAIESCFKGTKNIRKKPRNFVQRRFIGI
jgi:hypothetical protein